MAKFFALLGMLIWTSLNAASACPALVNAPPPDFPPLFTEGPGPQPYYCSASQVPQNIGDLSPSEWAKRVQVCNTACNYEPLIPGDPHSMLISTDCGPGWHDRVYMVEPPRASKGGPAVKVVNTSCKDLAPSKAPPAPAPAPAASPPA